MLQRLERGENMDDDDIFGRGSGEARDDISNLPLKVAVKVRSRSFIVVLWHSLGGGGGPLWTP